jgi:hypothetical protein
MALSKQQYQTLYLLIENWQPKKFILKFVKGMLLAEIHSEIMQREKTVI